jgi:hypothetical protein
MAKGQARPNKEKRKPKVESKSKPVSAYKAAQGLGSSTMTTGSLGNSLGKKN